MLRFLFKLFALLILGASLAGGWLWMDMQRSLREPLHLGAQPQTFVVKPGMTMRAVADELARKGVLDHPWYLAFEARRQGKAGRIKAGEFELKPGMTPLGLIDLLVSGKVVQHSLTLVEGWTFRQMMDAVDADPYLKHTLEGLSPGDIMAEIGEAGVLPEGRFFPDTYHFPAGTADVEFLQRAFQTMRDVLQEEWEQRAPGLPYRNSYQALIMASLIEKETARPEERSRIAGVFVRRLERHMKLQTDPTVIYALGAAYDGDIHKKDLSIHSPYNTYLHKGLTPTPIAMPGRASIHAALHPASGKALYFVSRNDGSHQFSDTLAEHDKAVERYQLTHHNKPGP